MVEYSSPRSEILGSIVYRVTFTQDDYIYLDILKVNGTNLVSRQEDYLKKYKSTYIPAFYIDDNKNNTWLVVPPSVDDVPVNERIPNKEREAVKQKVIEFLKSRRKQVIANVCETQIEEAINNSNDIAEQLGIEYAYDIAYLNNEDSGMDNWHDTVNGIGIIAMVQGINLGNRLLNYTANNSAELTLTKKYYFANPLKDYSISVLNGIKYYHQATTCPLYEEYKRELPEGVIGLAPEYTYSRQVAAKSGFYPCPFCRP